MIYIELLAKALQRIITDDLVRQFSRSEVRGMVALDRGQLDNIQTHKITFCDDFSQQFENGIPR
jgi:hypothetical protein